jgi:hypothetical protein
MNGINSDISYPTSYEDCHALVSLARVRFLPSDTSGFANEARSNCLCYAPAAMTLFVENFDILRFLRSVGTRSGTDGPHGAHL